MSYSLKRGLFILDSDGPPVVDLTEIPGHVARVAGTKIMYFHMGGTTWERIDLDNVGGDSLPPGGDTGDFLSKASAADSDVEWTTFEAGYTYFPIWAEDSSTIAAGATEYAYGNGDETPAASGIVIGVDCELFACGGEAEASTGVNLEVLKNGGAVAETGLFDSNGITQLVTPISILAGDIINFRTKAVGSSGASCRPVAWFRVEVAAPKGPKGDAGAPGDLDWQGEWSAGTYTENQTVQFGGSSFVCNKPTTTETPSAIAADWDLVAAKGEVGPEGGTQPFNHYGVGSIQNVGGANGTVTYINWDSAVFSPSAVEFAGDFTHSTTVNPSRIGVIYDGRYELKANIQVEQTGAARTTLMSGIRINGVTINNRGRQRNYSRGAVYGDLGIGLNTELDLLAGDYVEISITVDDTDATYTLNTIPAECEFIIRKIG